MITVVIPTYNEAENIVRLLEAIDVAMQKAGIAPYETLVMDDDSPDGTAARVETLHKESFRVINRRGLPRGLSRSAIHGFQRARYAAIALLDADFSHPPAVLPVLFNEIRNGANIAVGSRYVRGGGVENWPLKRRVASRAACMMARPVTAVKDATSGFFAFRREIIEGVSLDPAGFKIGLEIFVRSRHEGKIVEVPYLFRNRTAGTSKLSGSVMGAYGRQIVSLSLHRPAQAPPFHSEGLP